MELRALRPAERTRWWQVTLAVNVTASMDLKTAIADVAFHIAKDAQHAAEEGVEHRSGMRSSGQSFWRAQSHRARVIFCFCLVFHIMATRIWRAVDGTK